MKEILFDKYSKNLEEFLNLIPDLKKPTHRVYMCPLCRLIFSEKDLDHNSKNSLTIEHIPPEAVGGKELILTCKKCNNEHGSKFDSQVSEKLKLKKIFSLKPGSEHNKVRFSIGNDIKSNGSILVDEMGQFNVVLEEKRTNPKYHKDIIDIVTGKKGDVKVDFSLKTYNETKVKISILRSAYLKAFKELGYAFTFNSNSEIIRKRIVENPIKFEPVKGVFATTDKNYFSGLSVITKPSELQGYVVGLRTLKDSMEELYNVILPGGNDKGKHIYSEFERLKTTGNKELSNFEITSLDGDDFISGEDKFFALEYWGSDFVVHRIPQNKPHIT